MSDDKIGRIEFGSPLGKDTLPQSPVFEKHTCDHSKCEGEIARLSADIRALIENHDRTVMQQRDEIARLRAQVSNAYRNGTLTDCGSMEPCFTSRAELMCFKHLLREHDAFAQRLNAVPRAWECLGRKSDERAAIHESRIALERCVRNSRNRHVPLVRGGTE